MFVIDNGREAPHERQSQMIAIDVQPPEKRLQMIGTRMTDEEHARLKAAARKKGMMVATVMRQLCLAWADSVLSRDDQ